MKTKQLIPIIAAAGLTCGTVQRAQATADTNKLSINLSFVAQGETTAKPTSSGAVIYTTKVDKFRGGDKDVLGLLESATGQTFPTGSFVEVDGDILATNVVVLVRSKTGSELANVTDHFFFEVTSPDIFAGTENDTTRVQSFTDYYTIRILFDDANGNSFDVTGVAQESFKATALNGNGEQTLTDSISIPVSGTATSAGDVVIVKGTITLKGKSISSD